MLLSQASRWTRHSVVFWSVLYISLWWLLSGGQGWYIGVPSIIGAVALSSWLGAPPLRLRLIALPRFILFFLGALLSGGWDVAYRALHPRLPLHPAWVHYPVQIKQPRYRLLFASLIGLLPGTLAARVDDDCLYMHVLDSHGDWQLGTARLEQQLIALLQEQQP